MKLNQVLAIETGVKKRVYDDQTRLHHASQKASLMNGFKSVYEPLDQDGEQFPPESQQVQLNYVEVLREVETGLNELFNVTATKDFANCKARANIVVDGQVLMSDVPATFLLFLEKQLKDLSTTVEKMTELDTAEEWVFDSDSGLHRSSQLKKHKTKKVQKSLVLLQPTEKHPGQAQMITDDQIVGFTTTTKLSGAIPKTKKKLFLQRIEKLSNAVKCAREDANSMEVEKQDSKALMDFVFGK